MKAFGNKSKELSAEIAQAKSEAKSNYKFRHKNIAFLKKRSRRNDRHENRIIKFV